MKVVVLGLDTNVNKRVTIHTTIMTFMIMKQYDTESNDMYLMRFMLMVQTLKIAGNHILVSKIMIGKKLYEATDDEIEIEKK